MNGQKVFFRRQNHRIILHMASSDLQPFLDDEGRLASWPSKAKKQMPALRFLAEKLEWDRIYTEREINDLLGRNHTFGDAALLRRELFMKRFLDRKADGSAYWRTQRQLPAAWKSERLTVRDAVEKDLPELRNACEECSYIQELTGYRDDAEDPMLAEFRGELLPPHGKKELHRLQTIMEASTRKVIGYLITYHGFPDHGTFWIASLAIRPTFQRQKFGKEVLENLTKNVEELGGYSRMGIAVGVGNDPAMRFWSACGFNEVIKTDDHGTHAEQWIVKTVGE